jgi:hypothetical protein
MTRKAKVQRNQNESKIPILTFPYVRNFKSDKKKSRRKSAIANCWTKC